MAVGQTKNSRLGFAEARLETSRDRCTADARLVRGHVLPYAVMYQSLGKRRIMPTINLQIDYVAPAMMGSWVHGEASVLRVTRTIAFVQGLAFADGEVIARASGIFKLGNHIEGGDGDFFGLKSVS